MAKLITHENDRAVYSFEIAWEEFDKEVNQVFQKNRSRFRIHGFRQGKAPRKIIEMNYGEGIFYEDALNHILDVRLGQVAKELELEVIGRPDVDIKTIEKNQPLEIQVEQDTRPHPSLGDYKGMEVVRASLEVPEAEIDRVIGQEQEKNSVLRPVDRPAQEGDTILLDYAGTVDGLAFDGGTAEEQSLVLGSKTFIPGFEEQIVGHLAGDAFNVPVTFPEDYHAEELAGKDAVFAVELREVQVKEVPELNDDFAQDVSEYDTMEEYRASVKKDLEDQAKERAERAQENAAVDKLIEISDIHVPQSMVEDQVEVEIRNMANQISQMGIPLDKYLEYTGQTIEQMRSNYEPQARQRVAADLAIQALVEEQKLEATEEEIQKEMEDLAKTYGAQNPEDFIKRLKDMHQEDLVADDVRKQKALDYLMTQVVLVDPPKEEKTEDQDQGAKEEVSEEKAEEPAEN